MIAEINTIGIKTVKKNGALPLFATPAKTKFTPSPAKANSCSNSFASNETTVVPNVVLNNTKPNTNCKTNITNSGFILIALLSVLINKAIPKIKIKPIIPKI